MMLQIPRPLPVAIVFIITSSQHGLTCYSFDQNEFSLGLAGYVIISEHVNDAQVVNVIHGVEVHN